MFTKYIENWKFEKDQDRKLRIMQLMQRFWFSTERQEFLVKLMLEENFNSEELECVSNILGKAAHERSRKEKR